MERPTPTNVSGLGERLHALIASQRIRRTLGATVLVLSFMDVAGLQTKHESSSSLVHVPTTEAATNSHVPIEAEPRYLSYSITETIDPTLSKPPKPSKVIKLAGLAVRPAIVPSCEQYRDEITKIWPADQIDNVMLVMTLESKCDKQAISRTKDYGLMQLHNIPVFDPVENLRIAYERKYQNPRVGDDPNYSAWYTVCTPGNNPIPKYPGISCK